jgi:cytosine/adenosine deaminase-related metal-dependent hydrolase
MQPTQPRNVDFAAIKSRQHAAWGSGDYAIVGTTVQIVGETLCEAVDLRAGERVLDVAAGNGNATLAAARRFAEVVSTDLCRGASRAGPRARQGRPPPRHLPRGGCGDALFFGSVRKKDKGP